MKEVNRLVIERTSSDVALIPEVARYLYRFRRKAFPADRYDRLGRLRHRGGA